MGGLLSNLKILICTFLFLSPGFIVAQDTIKVKRANFGDEYCWLTIYTHKKVYRDSISVLVIISDDKAELQMNKNCPRLKNDDVFVSSFEVEWKGQVIKAESSFFTDKQKKMLKDIGPGDSFTIKNVVLHAPDAFKKMEDMKIAVY